METPSAETVRTTTAALQARIDAVAEAGGGRVVVPAGTHVVGTLFLRSRVDLHLEHGCVLLASPRHTDFTYHDFGGHPLESEAGFWHLLVADRCEDVSLTGRGSIDGNGTAYYEPSRGPLTWPRAVPADRRMRTLVEFQRCHRVLVEGVRLGNVSNWTLHLNACTDVSVRDIAIENPPTAPNADGIDITGCRNVRVSGCTIDTCDDAICLKTFRHSPPCEDVVVTGCVIRTHCVALKIGCKETWQDIRDVVFADCVVRGSSRAVGIYSTQGKLVENVLVSNIVADTRAPLMFTRPLHVDAHRFDASVEGPSRIRRVRVQGLHAETDGRILLTAAPGCSVRDVVLHDLSLVYPVIEDPAIRGATVGGSQFSKGNPWARVERAALVAENLHGLRVDAFQVTWPDGPCPPAWDFPEKMANGSDVIYPREDFHPADPFPFAAVSTRNVLAARIAPPIESREG